MEVDQRQMPMKGFSTGRGGGLGVFARQVQKTVME